MWPVSDTKYMWRVSHIGESFPICVSRHIFTMLYSIKFNEINWIVVWKSFWWAILGLIWLISFGVQRRSGLPPGPACTMSSRTSWKLRVCSNGLWAGPLLGLLTTLILPQGLRGLFAYSGLQIIFASIWGQDWPVSWTYTTTDHAIEFEVVIELLGAKLCEIATINRKKIPIYINDSESKYPGSIYDDTCVPRQCIASFLFYFNPLICNWSVIDNAWYYSIESVRTTVGKESKVVLGKNKAPFETWKYANANA